MQLESLKMFCDVVETGSFSRAAQLNHVTQSAVSQQIRALENRYEQKLLSRSARQVTPTPAGERLFRGCKEILSRFGGRAGACSPWGARAEATSGCCGARAAPPSRWWKRWWCR